MGETPFVVGVRWTFGDKDAGSPDSSAIGATEGASIRASSAARRHDLVFREPS